MFSVSLCLAVRTHVVKMGRALHGCPPPSRGPGWSSQPEACQSHPPACEAHVRINRQAVITVFLGIAGRTVVPSNSISKDTGSLIPRPRSRPLRHFGAEWPGDETRILIASLMHMIVLHVAHFTTSCSRADLHRVDPSYMNDGCGFSVHLKTEVDYRDLHLSLGQRRDGNLTDVWRKEEILI